MMKARTPFRDASSLIRPAPPPPNLAVVDKRAKTYSYPGMSCNYCGKPGYTAKFCFRRARDEGDKPRPLAIQPHPPQSVARPPISSQPPFQRPATLLQNRAPIARVFAMSAEERSSVVKELNLELNNLERPLVIVSLVEGFVEAARFCPACLVVLEGHETCMNLVVMKMKQFDIIIGMDWPTQAHAILDCHARMVTVMLPGQSPFTMQGRRQYETYEGLWALEKTESTEITINQIPVVSEFPEVFQDPGLPPRREADFTINLLPGTTPIFMAQYRMPSCEMEELRVQINELLGQGFIHPNVSPWGAPVLFVKKKDRSQRLCIDYRRLNRLQ
ncbi:uncharacterized protein LOC131223965 [Magnolia sinica]|uniref:uncharacterized protein LOC131223965 n=1 Tax=Magnolia sinica TaxID=86752 RepID=UPI00265822A6|nr:uncharacterized protein LOC131223965 [Magnolia sinica]